MGNLHELQVQRDYLQKVIRTLQSNYQNAAFNTPEQAQSQSIMAALHSQLNMVQAEIDSVQLN